MVLFSGAKTKGFYLSVKAFGIASILVKYQK
jgi:hypothetical protein